MFFGGGMLYELLYLVYVFGVEFVDWFVED